MTKHMIKRAIPLAVALICSQAAFAQTSALNALPGTKPVETLQAEKMAPAKEVVTPQAATPVDTTPVVTAKPKVLSARIQEKEEPEVKKATPKATAKPVSFRVIKGEYVEAFAAPDKSKQVAQDTRDKILVSDRDWNRFVFGKRIKNVIFSQGTPVPEDGITYLAGNTQVMVRFDRSYEKPAQMVVELENDEVETLYLQIKPVSGAVYKHASARVASMASSKSNAPGTSPSAVDIKLIEALVQGKGLDGFDDIPLPRISKFDNFSAIPVAAMSDRSSKQVLVFQLVANPGKVAVVAPPQFYRPGVSAAMVDGDRVDDNTSPMLYIVEEITGDE